MKITKKKLIIFGVILLFIIILIVNQNAYKTGEGLNDETKKINIDNLVKQYNYDKAIELADNYYYYDKNLDKHQKYLLYIQVCKENNLNSLDEAEKKLSEKNSSKSKDSSNKKEENEAKKVTDEFKKITDDINAIGINNLTEEQTVSFINKYMVFWDTNKVKHNELHDQVVENLIKLKQKYYLQNKYYIDSNMKVYKARIGMTKDEVVAFTKYIEAEDINKTTTKYSTREQYCYSNGDYLYFENGILSTIQE